jgi:hypothetical protein
MSESSNEPTGSAGDADTGTETGSPETPEVGLISDEQLPEDLQPERNPLARDPEDESEDSGEDPSAKVEGMPDMGQPGAGA